MQLFVRGPGNATTVVEIGAEENVRVLKLLLWARMRIPVERMWLESGGRHLRDEMSMAYYGLGQESMIWCHIRAGGGDCPVCRENLQRG
jgi:hypothetical protein